ncbi:LysM peptidoglycan-binding domain-containing protein, partial [Mycobacterium sp. 1274756.6]|uniref:LysM peptidoglycan-binding domain-containing protein n=1 Tax=Mycobacterium sp. 1274756.6 TaxID=1834076 RepID=UPI0007FECC38
RRAHGPSTATNTVAVRVAGRPHRRRPVTPATTVVLALLAALITVWLGIVAQFGAAVAAQAETVPAELAVVRVQTGETLEHLAARVAPGAPTSRVAATIRELNGLDSAVLEAGQTLIAPVR